MVQPGLEVELSVIALLTPTLIVSDDFYCVKQSCHKMSRPKIKELTVSSFFHRSTENQPCSALASQREDCKAPCRDVSYSGLGRRWKKRVERMEAFFTSGCVFFLWPLMLLHEIRTQNLS